MLSPNKSLFSQISRNAEVTERVPKRNINEIEIIVPETPIFRIIGATLRMAIANIKIAIKTNKLKKNMTKG